MKRNAIIPLLAAMLLAVICGPAPAAEPPALCVPAEVKLDVQPPALTIGTFYSGQSARLVGELEEGQEVALELKGPSENASFDLKGKVGPFWMNRGLVQVENAPTLYILLLPAQTPPEAELESLGLGMTHLKGGVKVVSPGQDPEQIFAKFLEFKKASGLYQQRSGAVTYAPAGQGRRAFYADFDFPSSLAAGQCQVVATVFENGAVLGRLEKTYVVEDGPFLALVKGLALDRALLFGVLCVLIALVTGAVMGVVFKGGKGGH